MANPAPNTRSEPWRLPLLSAVTVLIVVGPALLLNWATHASLKAADRVQHSVLVEARAQQLTYEVRNLEAATLALGMGIDTPRVRERMAESTRNTPRVFDALTALTRDNPTQQLRLGTLRAQIDQRLAIAQRVGRGHANEQREDIVAMVTQFPILESARDILAEEHRLVRERIAEDARVRRRTQLLRWSAMVAQLMLLGSLVWFSQRDLAQRRAAERELRSASARAYAVMQTVREPIVLVDGAQRVLMHNAAFSELYGDTADEADKRPLAEIGGSAWRDPEMLQRLADVLSRGRELWDFQQPQRTADGVDRVMLVNARQMTLPDRDDAVALITVSDISAQKASESRIQELNRQLEGKIDQVSEINRELEAFSYSVSHDLRAPLRHIAGFADKLGKHLGDKADEKSHHYLGVIGSSARRMSTLIDDLLVYSRLGRSALRLQPVDMQSQVADVRAMLEANSLAEAPEHRIDWHIGPLPIVAGDDNMLRQVWQNLLGNAVKYSGKREPAVIEVSHRYTEDGSHHFTVADNGAGFDMAYASKLFGVFQRLHKASDYAGTGIGLASVRRVLLRHGGRIWAEAEPDAGATFHFTLPATLSPAADTTESST